jgi:DNA-binding NtrC family response regulator
MLFRKFALDFADKYRMEPIQLIGDAREMITGYSWPGNVRELRNVVEQLSILSEDKMITRERLLDTIPDIMTRHLPRRIDQDGENLQERELLYKVLFDMKNDLNDLKSLIFELIKTNNLRVSDMGGLKQLQLAGPSGYSSDQTPNPNSNPLRDSMFYPPSDEDSAEESDSGPVIVSKEDYDEMEVVEDNLSLEEMEKEYITKALKKYNNRRKEAADELGISERTLYRKIKYYGL